MPGCGKSTLGKKLAKYLNWDFADLDHLIEQQEKKNISDIFALDGESYFREIEKRILFETERSEQIVIACGGGTPIYENNMIWMNNHGITIYLNAPIPLLMSRIFDSKTSRPLFKTLNKEELEKNICDLYYKRSPVFAQAKASFLLPVKSYKSLYIQVLELIKSENISV